MIVKKGFFLLLIFAVVTVFFSCFPAKLSEPKGVVLPKRIVSLSPSLTSEIIDLKSEKLLVGVTSYHPPLKNKVTVIGTLISPVIESILRQKPDIVLLSAEDEVTQKTEFLKRLNIPVQKFNRNNSFKGVCKNFIKLANIIGKKKLALSLLKKYKSKRNFIIKNIDYKNERAVFLVSVKPFITVSKTSYINNLLVDLKMLNPYDSLKVSYPLISMESIVKNNPDIIFVMQKDGILFLKEKFSVFKLKAIKNKRVYFINPNIVALYTPKHYIKSLVLLKGKSGK